MPRGSSKTIQKWIPNLQEAPKILRGCLTEPTGPQGGEHYADFFDFMAFFGSPRRTKIDVKSPLGRPKRRPRRLRSQKNTSLETTSCKNWPRTRFWTVLDQVLMIFHQKCLQKDKENPSQIDVAIRPGTDQLQSLEVQISLHIPMRQRVPPKSRKNRKSSSEAQSEVYKSKNPD